MNINNLPVAIIVHDEINPEITTLNPVNDIPLARIATEEDIADEDDYDVEIAQRDVRLHSVNISTVDQMRSESPVSENNRENLNRRSTTISGRQNINKFINIRKYALIFYTPILLLHLLYIFVNPTAMLFLLNIFYNLFTIVSANNKLIKTNIMSNIITVIFIILADILFLFNINDLLFYILRKEFSVFKVELYYLITLYVTSILIIITYVYLTITLNILRVLYNTFTPHQINVLNLLLKNN
tara:strand:+ start:214 stop:939 length:726 start_codon:yes stop_codon:yes gene_type:complete